MTLTRSQVETILISRCGPSMVAAGMAVTAQATTFNDPIASALRTMSLSISNRAAVVDGDIAGVSAEREEMFLDLCEFRLTESIISNLDDVDTQIGPRSEKFSQLRDSLERKVKRLADRISKIHRIGEQTLTVGTISLDFAEKPTWEA